MTIGNATLARDVELVRVLRALVNVAIAARDVVNVAEARYDDLLLVPDAQDAHDVLDRLDAALTDAGELLAEVAP